MDVSVSSREVYDQKLPDGTLYGKIGPRDVNRFKDTIRHLDPASESILDVGCNAGEWLDFVLKHRPMPRHLGIDVAPSKIDEAMRRFPHLNLQVAFAEQLEAAEGEYDTVTCLEVLEHIPDWLSVFHSLFRFSKRQVLVTVPYREQIIHTMCVHCAQLTPLYGHLRSYTEDSFPVVPGWTRTFVRIASRDPGRRFGYRLYRWFNPLYRWLLVDYRRDVSL